MKDVIYCGLMSILIGGILGVIVGELFDILFPDIALDPLLFVAFFAVVTWGILSVLQKSRSAS
jgi:hypothetical protein